MTFTYLRIPAACLAAALLSSLPVSYGQDIADTLQMEEVTVSATRIDAPQKLQPVFVNVVDSARLALWKGEDIGTLLAMESSLFIKSHGPGGFANASQRGLSPEQLQVLWEGIPINHSMLGLTDLSLLPSSFFSSVQVSSGVPSSSFGGGLSGGLYLGSDFSGENRVSLTSSAGSFGRYGGGLQAAADTGPWTVSLRSRVARHENDFEYYNRATRQLERRRHNRQEQDDLLASVGYESGPHQLQTRFWLSGSENEIPGSILKNDSRSWQNDQALRWLTSYRTRVGELEITAKNYVDRVELDYLDDDIDVQSHSTTRRWIASSAFRYEWRPQVNLKGEVSGGITGVRTNNYAGDRQRRRLSALINPELQLDGRRLRLYPALRLDSYSDFGTVVSPSLGVNYELAYDRLYLRGQLSRDFNPPTFNALYWAPGGNPELAPERSRSVEAGLIATPEAALLQRLNVTAYYNRVHNGIRWYPDRSGTYTPSNIEDIRSQGIELTTRSRLRLAGDAILKLTQRGAWTQTEITEARFEGDAAVGHQMRYVPRWSYNASLMIERGAVALLGHYGWTGRRYVTDTEDPAQSLDPYHKVDATLRAAYGWGALRIAGKLRAANLLNTDYEVIQWYAMPRRHYQMHLTVTYHY